MVRRRRTQVGGSAGLDGSVLIDRSVGISGRRSPVDLAVVVVVCEDFVDPVTLDGGSVRGRVATTGKG
jgi:hypothetical protein